VKRDVPDRARLVREVVREIRRHPPLRLVVSSFDPIMIAAVRAALPRTLTALLVHRSSYHDLMLRARPLTLASGMHVEHVLFDEARRTVLGRPAFVLAWTINAVSDARRVVELGARGIITDDPAHILQGFAVTDNRRG